MTFSRNFQTNRQFSFTFSSTSIKKNDFVNQNEGMLGETLKTKNIFAINIDCL